MAQHMFVVFIEALPGREAEFNDWYDNQHMPDVLAVPGFVSGQRFRLRDEPGRSEGPARYMTVYDLDTADVGATIAEVYRRAGTPAMPSSDSVNQKAFKALLADPIGAPILAPQAVS